MERNIGNQHAQKFSEERWRLVIEKLELRWSPEQISCEFKKSKVLEISHETIYRYLLRDKRNGGMLYKFLRCQKKRRKRFSRERDKRGVIKNRVGIELRPSIVDSRERIGDWEGDLVVGKAHKGALVTLVERKTGFLMTRAVPNKEARR